MRVCVHRGECMRMYMSACVCIDVKKQRHARLFKNLDTFFLDFSDLLCMVIQLPSTHRKWTISICRVPRLLVPLLASACIGPQSRIAY